MEEDSMPSQYHTFRCGYPLSTRLHHRSADATFAAHIDALVAWGVQRPHDPVSKGSLPLWVKAA
jgi:hypothetical protein